MTEKIPQCIGIIMDGNRRWAHERGLTSFEGHKQGYEKMKKVVRWARKAGVGALVFYVFSTENWKRTEEEVGYLMRLFETALTNELDEIQKENARIRFIGERERLSPTLQKLMRETEERTKNNGAITVALAISYGGRPEIVSAARRLFREMRDGTENEITEETFSKYLSTRGIHDPDIIIRTGGEKRLSNFLSWQSAYSELFFIDTYWPEFSEREFQNVLEVFSNRERRRGR